MAERARLIALSFGGLVLASCGLQAAGDSPRGDSSRDAFRTRVAGSFDEPWAMAIEPETGTVFITQKAGSIRFLRPDGRQGVVSGVPPVDHGGQGGLGDIAFAPSPARGTPGLQTIYLTYVEPGPGDTRGAALGRGDLDCTDGEACRIAGFRVIWRQEPKVTGRGHFSHRIAFSPDGRYLFLSSGDRQKMTPAQDLTNNLGKVVRLLPDGSAAPDNPFAAMGGVSAQIWSLGHRNVLGLKFDAKGALWGLEHGPRGGDELNRIEPGANYGWPLVSEGSHYSGESIPAHTARPDIRPPALSWHPVIAPGNFIIYRGNLFAGWEGQALIAAMKPAGVVRVALDGNAAREIARHPTDHRIRDLAEAPDGSIWLLEDGKERGAGRLLRITPRSP